MVMKAKYFRRKSEINKSGKTFFSLSASCSLRYFGANSSTFLAKLSGNPLQTSRLEILRLSRHSPILAPFSPVFQDLRNEFLRERRVFARMLNSSLYLSRSNTMGSSCFRVRNAAQWQRKGDLWWVKNRQILFRMPFENKDWVQNYNITLTFGLDFRWCSTNWYRASAALLL